ncbi:MAG TPA: DUF3772 domain-containing protein [Caulobacteraceae bacterium]|jgi:small-conductance mechanosensitive channel
MKAALILALTLVATAAGASPVPAPPNAIAAATNALSAPPATNAAAAPASNAVAAPAAAPPVVAPPPLSLQQIENQAAASSNDTRLAVLEAQAAAIEAQARRQEAAVAAQIAGVDQATAALSPHGRRPARAADRLKLAQLTAQRATLASQLAPSQVLAAQAQAALVSIAERRREGYSARLLAPSPSPLSPDFWSSLSSAVSDDAQRLASAANDAVATALGAAEPRGLIAMAVAALIAFGLVWPARRVLEQLGRRKTGEAVHPGFARTGAALWVAAVDAGAPTLAALLLRLTAKWAGLLSEPADAIAGAGVGAIVWAASILALGRVLATDNDARQRLLPIPDSIAKRIKPPLGAVAIVTAAGLLLSRLNYVIGASVAATIAANCVLALAYAAVAGLILVSFGRGREAPLAPGERHDETPASSPAASPVWTLISLVLSIAIVVTVGAVFAGYTTLAAMTAGQIFWLSVIFGATYLLVRFVDDACSALFSDNGWASHTLYLLFNFRRSTVRQLGVLIGAALQLIVLAGAVSFALTPFGEGGDAFFARIGAIGSGIRIGQISISPTALIGGLVTFFVGLALVRLVRGWFLRRYLPVTDWDSGVRNSVSTGVGYLGVAIVLIGALAVSGLGFSQIALVASALSVGIGFGLQQVVQNFVAGVIVLVERPIKVGDWVDVDGVEGDVRRIRVRATEIQTQDRSTVIIPNSDLITTKVRNMTMGGRYGRIQLRLSITDPANAAKARELILGLAKGAKGVAENPPPEVFIEGLSEAGGVNLSCYVYVASPRDTYRVRSDLYASLLQQLRDAGIAFTGVKV